MTKAFPSLVTSSILGHPYTHIVSSLYQNSPIVSSFNLSISIFVSGRYKEEVSTSDQAYLHENRINLGIHLDQCQKENKLLSQWNKSHTLYDSTMKIERYEVNSILSRYLQINKLASLEATLVRNYDPPTD